TQWHGVRPRSRRRPTRVAWELFPGWHGNYLLLTVDCADLACHNLANGRRLVSDRVTVGKQMVVSVLLRFAASVFCVLTAVLLIGGGGGGVADAGFHGSRA